MDPRDAATLIRAAIPRPGGAWADLGAGDGTFTRALVTLVGADATIFAVERDAQALTELDRWAKAEAANVIPVAADFTAPFDLPGLDGAGLDGMLLANALHFVRDAGPVLAGLTARLRPGARLVLVEYDRRRASRWVPYPIPITRLPELAAAAGLTTPVVTATRPSAYGGLLYVAATDRLPGSTGRG